jgi:hypothetical protein
LAPQKHGWLYTEIAESDLDAAEWKIWRDRALRDEDENAWFPDYKFTRYPTKAKIGENDPQLVLKGYQPKQPLITKESKVVAFGSCFAAHFAEWLALNGYNQEFTASCRAIMRNPFENAPVIAQQFRWAFGELDPQDILWVTKDKQHLIATEERRAAIRQIFLEADVFVTTLSMSEVWYDRITGEPLWRVTTTETHDPRRHAFKVSSFAETLQAFETIEQIRAKWLPNLKIIYTVSPLPLATTFREISPVVANTASKAIVRAALDEFLRSRDDLNETYFYFPAYELVNTFFTDPFQTDNRHLYDYGVDAVLSLFAKTFTDGELVANGSWEKASALSTALDELNLRIGASQEVAKERLDEIVRLKAACDERLATIGALVETCDARLEAINTGKEQELGEIRSLRAECDRRLNLINSLTQTCDQRMSIIESLKSACDERLTIIDSLGKTCAERLELINSLNSTCEERLKIIDG